VEDRQAELRGVTARIDQLRDDVDPLGLSFLIRKPRRLHHPHFPAHTDITL
jgi:hypothetical protein